jgi:CRP-like cAMP-binding protein
MYTTTTTVIPNISRSTHEIQIFPIAGLEVSCELIAVPQLIYQKSLRDLDHVHNELKTKAAFLKLVPCLRSWKPARLNRLAYLMKRKNVHFNSPIAHEGEKIAKIYIIVKGEVRALQLKDEAVERKTQRTLKEKLKPTHGFHSALCPYLLTLGANLRSCKVICPPNPRSPLFPISRTTTVFTVNFSPFSNLSCVLQVPISTLMATCFIGVNELSRNEDVYASGRL